MRPTILLGAMLMGLLSGGAALAYDTGDAGGPGGSAFRAECAPGSVLVKIEADSGKDLNLVLPICATMQDGQILEGLQTLNAFGTNAETFLGVNAFGDGLLPPTCFGNSAVSAINVRLSRHQTIHTFSLTCRDVATGQEEDSVLASTQGGEGFARQSVRCNPGDIAIGLRGHYGALIDSLGLICAPIPKPAPAPSPGAKIYKSSGKKVPAPVNDPGTPGAVDNSDQGGEAGRANTETTIYDSRGGSDVGYLGQGDRVTIVQCRSDWCQISEPMEGWVWGPDLDR